VVKSGIPWRYLPADFPPWKTVCHIFRQGTLNHQWAALNAARRILVRKTDGKRAQLTAAILDSQSVKSAGHGGNVGGYAPGGDGNPPANPSTIPASC
jgi:transposase